ncbi:hypothetical protein MIR68_000057 [Amoeboaphelidium protococcarum]|nr:hypothetical protein MIR68_000057 [Amoeboaphelidium protococcarum]
MGNANRTYSLPVQKEDLAGLRQERVVGNSRFMKGIKCTDGQFNLVMVKILQKDLQSGSADVNPTEQYQEFIDQLNDLKHKLRHVQGVLMHDSVIQNDRFVIGIRPFLYMNLYDRMSTRPFLCAVEKQFIVFQLMKLLCQLELVGVVHGDLKTQNILITSWNQIYITDFSSLYKPHTLPIDNSADYSYYFDSSGQRVCYIAPERFIAASSSQQSAADNNFQLTPLCDVFSMGCIFAELFMDGSPMFTLSTLLQYIENRQLPHQSSSVWSSEYSDLIQDMLKFGRDSASTLLEKHQDIFPHYFDDYLYSFYQQLESGNDQSLNDCEYRISKMFMDFHQVCEKLSLIIDLSKEKSSDSEYYVNIPGVPIRICKWKSQKAAVLVANIVTSQIRSVVSIATKLQAMDMLLYVSCFLDEACIMQRIVPYFVLLLQDGEVRVRCRSIKILIDVLSMVDLLPVQDCLFLNEYLVDNFKPLLRDTSHQARAQFAASLSQFASIGHKWLSKLNLSSMIQDQSAGVSEEQFSYDQQVSEFNNVLQQWTVHLLLDSSSTVKLHLLQSIGQLSVILGGKVCADVILSHLITYLNDKDQKIRAAFFQALHQLGLLIGISAVDEYVKPLIQQALYDQDDGVVAAVLSCATQLVESKCFSNIAVNNLSKSVVPLLLHPNVVIRRNCVRLFHGMSTSLSRLDFKVFVMPQLEPYLQIQLGDLFQLGPEYLVEPLSRQLFAVTNKTMAEVRKQKVVESQGRPFYRMKSIANKSEQTVDMEMLAKVFSAHSLSEEDLRRISLIAPYVMKLNLSSSLAPQSQSDIKLLKAYQTNARPRTVFLSPSVTGTLSKHSSLRIRHRSVPSIKFRHDIVASLDQRDTQSEPDNEVRNEVVEGQMLQVPNESLLTVNRHGRVNSTSTVSHTYSVASTASAVMPVGKVSDEQRFKAEPVAEINAGFVEGALQQHDQRKQSSIENLDKVSSMSDQHQLQQLGLNRPASSTGVRMSNSVRIAGRDNNGASEFPMIRPLLNEKSQNAFPQNKFEFGKRLVGGSPLATGAASSKQNSISQWKPAGVLLATFTEHSDRANQLSLSPDSRYFISSSSDGSLKLFDCGQLESDVMFHSQLSYTQRGAQWQKVHFCNGTQTVFACHNSGAEVLNVEYNFSAVSGDSQGDNDQKRITALQTCSIPSQSIYSSCVVDDQKGIFAIASDCNTVNGWDIRCDRSIWTFKNPSYLGYISSMCADSLFSSWLTLGTDRGVISCWDIRFMANCQTWLHPSQQKIEKMVSYKSYSAQRCKRIFCSAGENELALWDLERGEYREVFCARPISEKIPRYVQSIKALPPPGSRLNESALKFQQSPKSVFTTFWYRSDTNFLLTAGTDRHIRYWNLASIEKSFAITKGVDDLNRQSSSSKFENMIFHYERSLKSALKPSNHGVNTAKSSSISGGGTQSATLLAHALNASPKSVSGGKVHPEQISSYHEKDHMYHTSGITDLIVTEYPSPVLITSSSDGAVKAWK